MARSACIFLWSAPLWLTRSQHARKHGKLAFVLAVLQSCDDTTLPECSRFMLTRWNPAMGWFNKARTLAARPSVSYATATCEFCSVTMRQYLGARVLNDIEIFPPARNSQQHKGSRVDLPPGTRETSLAKSCGPTFSYHWVLASVVCWEVFT